MNKVIILLGQRVRSGTNFVGTTMSMHPDVTTLPPNKSLGEFNLFDDDYILQSVYHSVVKHSFGMDFSVADEALFLKHYGAFWVTFLKEKYAISEDKVIFVKSPDIKHLALWQATFPESRIAIIYRDGRDNVISSVRASNDKRTWHNTILKFKKRFNYLTGRSFINHSKRWAKSANDILQIEPSEQLKLFKYEDLNDSEANITKLLKHYQLKVTDSIVEKCMKAPVVGSSFGVKTESMIKPNWQPDANKSKYSFSNKWKTWNFLKKFVFKHIAGKELINLGFEKNNNW